MAKFTLKWQEQEIAKKVREYELRDLSWKQVKFIIENLIMNPPKNIITTYWLYDNAGNLLETKTYNSLS